MLPWVYDPDAESGGGGNAKANERESEQGPSDYNPEGYLAEYYQNYEKQQNSLYHIQMEALRKRDDTQTGGLPSSRSRDRSRERRRSRSRSPSRNRNTRDRRRRDDRSRSRSRTRRRSRSRENRGGSPVPSHTLVLTNMPNDVDRNMISMLVAATGFVPQDVRIVNKARPLFFVESCCPILQHCENIMLLATGASRSFGFIDFADVKTAARWMDMTKGVMCLPDRRRINVQYARADGPSTTTSFNQDWLCANCGADNFLKRRSCFKCETTKLNSEMMEQQGMHMIGTVPCDTLLLRQLPLDVSTASIFEGLIKNTTLRVIVQLQLSESKAFAFVQMRSIEDATELVNSSYNSPIKVFDTDVILTYCRLPLSQMTREQILGCPQKLPGQQSAAQVSGAEVAQAAMLRAAQRQGHSSHSSSSLPFNATGPPPMMSVNMSVPPPMGSYNIPPPVIHGATQSYGAMSATVPPPVNQQTAAGTHSNGVIGIVPTPVGVLSKYVPPNPLSFVLEPSTGYFLDPVTNFYYDAKTTYYYNNASSEWTYWDPVYNTYFSVQPNHAPGGTPLAVTDPSLPAVVHGDPNNRNAERMDQPAESKSATQVAKEMMKWAKKQEKQKLQFTMKPLVKPLETKSAFEQPMASTSDADIALKMLEKAKNPLANMSDDSDDEQVVIPGGVRHHTVDHNRRRSDRQSPPLVQTVCPPVVHAGHIDTPVVQAQLHERPVLSAQEQREAMERSLIDESKKMCLLCKRAFPSLDVLRKHIEKSDLHKKNLEEKRVEWGRQYVASLSAQSATTYDTGPPINDSNWGTAEAAAPKMVYRDRAKERRQQFGIDSGFGRDAGPSDFGRSEESLRNESDMIARRPLDESNIGSKLLKSMGWKEGQGVGKHGQGIVAPVEAERRVVGAGLGAMGSKITHGVEASHKERVRASFYNRYHEMNQ